jgi:hypothetical protein
MEETRTHEKVPKRDQTFSLLVVLNDAGVGLSRGRSRCFSQRFWRYAVCDRGKDH